MMRAIDEAVGVFARARLLGPLVETMLAAGSTAGAHMAADELMEIADDLGAPLLAAIAQRARGAVQLAEGDPRASLSSLRASLAGWQRLDAPYDAARTRVLVGLACRALGDGDAAALELGGAAETFRELGARPDLARVEAMADAPGAAGAGPLTRREVEVIRLVAAGKSNRAIADELVISDRTVARHLSNIFDKLDVPSRAAATAWAYEHGLVATE